MQKMNLFLKMLNKIKDKYIKAYSQEGEDVILKRIFGISQPGFYVDIGAHHPTRFSNTYLFYKHGWSGVNIDGMPGVMDFFAKKRPRDINIEAVVSDVVEKIKFYIFTDHAYNTTNKEEADYRVENYNTELVSVLEVNTVQVNDILEKYVPDGTDIDFLTIDVEGLDVKILKGIDLKKYRPRIILLEIAGKTIPDLFATEPVIGWLEKQDYIFFSKTVNTLFFIESNFHIKRFLRHE